MASNHTDSVQKSMASIQCLMPSPVLMAVVNPTFLMPFASYSVLQTWAMSEQQTCKNWSTKVVRLVSPKPQWRLRLTTKTRSRVPLGTSIMMKLQSPDRLVFHWNAFSACGCINYFLYLQVVMGGKNKYLINGSNVQNNRVQDFFRSVQLNVNNPHFLIMQGRITKVF